MNKVTKKILKYLGCFVLGIFLLIFALAFSILNWPEKILTETNLSRMSKLLPSTEISWKVFDVKRKSYGLLNKELSFIFEDLCVEHNASSLKFKTCVPKGLFVFEYDLSNFKVELVKIGPIELHEGTVYYESIEKTENKKTVATEKSFPDISNIKMPDFLKNTKFSPIDISLTQVEYVAGKQKFSGPINLKVETKNNNIESALAETKVADNSGHKYNIKVSLTSGDSFKSDKWKIVLDADADLKQNDLDARVNLIWDRDSKKYSIKSDVRFEEIKSNFSLSGIYDEKLITLKTNLTATGLNESLENVSLDDCEIKLESTNQSNNDGKLEYDCPIQLALKRYKSKIRNGIEYQSPKDLILDWTGEFSTFFYPDLSHPIKGSTKAILKTSTNDLVDTKGSLSADLEGVPQDFPKDWKLVSDFELEFIIKKFEHVVDVLRDSDFAIWAPLNVLSGEAKVSIESSGNTFKNLSEIPIKLSTRLNSEKQEMNIDGEASVKINIANSTVQRAKIDGELILNKFSIQLPKINPVGIPQMLPDERIAISRKKMKKKDDLPIDYNFKIKTDKTSPLQIKYYLVKGFVPVELDLDVSNGGVAGNINILESKIEFFRRKATINNIKLLLTSDEVPIEINGLIGVNYADYNISLKLLGDIEKPSLVFQSNPPLSRENIFSVLLYGEPYDQLDYDQSESVGGASAAAADKAISLLSLFVLSSTPIQRIGYNPVTKEFSAKVKLAKGTSLNLGSSDTERQIGLQKRLGKGWLIRTVYEDPKAGETKKKNGTALIEWNKRY